MGIENVCQHARIFQDSPAYGLGGIQQTFSMTNVMQAWEFYVHISMLIVLLFYTYLKI